MSYACKLCGGVMGAEPTEILVAHKECIAARRPASANDDKTVRAVVALLDEWVAERRRAISRERESYDRVCAEFRRSLFNHKMAITLLSLALLLAGIVLIVGSTK